MRRPPAIDFYLYATHEVETWLPIVRRLRDCGADARFVLEPPGRHLARGWVPSSEEGWRVSADGPQAPLVDLGTHQALTRLLARVDEVPLARRRIRSAAAVTTQGSRWLRIYGGARVRTMYGVGFVLDAYGHGGVNEGFDLVLAHGEYSRTAIVQHVPHARVVAAGFPKWSHHLRGELDPDSARAALGLDEPYVAWVPTWAENSSIDRYVDAVASLPPHLRVVLKPHHNNSRFEQAGLEACERAGITILPVGTSLVDVLVGAALVLADPRSGGFTEALLADRPIVALTDEAGAAGPIHPGARECASFCLDPTTLRAAIEEEIQDPHREGRRMWRSQLFTDHGGADDAVAARAILEVAHHRWPMRRLTAVGWSFLYRAARRLGR